MHTKDNQFTRGNGVLESFLAKKRTKKANELIPENLKKGRVLDIGCGSYPYFLINSNFNQKYGIDPSLSSLEFKNLNLRRADAAKQKLPFADNFFDSVVMLAVFEHIEQKKLNPVLSEVKRVLKEGGVLVITTPSPWADKILHFMAIFGLISKEEIHEHKHNHAKSKIEDIIENIGFKKENILSGFFEAYMNMWFVIKK